MSLVSCCLRRPPRDEVSTGSAADRVPMLLTTRDGEDETRSLTLPVMTSPWQCTDTTVLITLIDMFGEFGYFALAENLTENYVITFILGRSRNGDRL